MNNSPQEKYAEDCPANKFTNEPAVVCRKIHMYLDESYSACEWMIHFYCEYIQIFIATLYSVHIKLHYI